MPDSSIIFVEFQEFSFLEEEHGIEMILFDFPKLM